MAKLRRIWIKLRDKSQDGIVKEIFSTAKQYAPLVVMALVK